MYFLYTMKESYRDYYTLPVFDTAPEFKKLSLRPNKLPTLKGIRRMMIPRIRADP
jgi:hypothetical protein